MTNPDNVGGLPEPVEYQYRYVGCEWQRCGKTYYETLLKHPYDRATMDRMEVRALHATDQLIAYGELCMALGTIQPIPQELFDRAKQLREKAKQNELCRAAPRWG